LGLPLGEDGQRNVSAASRGNSRKERCGSEVLWFDKRVDERASVAFVRVQERRLQRREATGVASRNGMDRAENSAARRGFD